MSERQMQSGDEGSAVCHVCGQRLETQADLLTHLREEHPDDLLDDPAQG